MDKNILKAKKLSNEHMKVKEVVVINFPVWDISSHSHRSWSLFIRER